MTISSTKKLALATLLSVITFFVQTLAQQKWTWPEKSKNLKVMNKNTTADELHQTMVGFAKSLGVKCFFCHVGKEGEPLTSFDFVSDEKPEKATTRKMMKMVKDINKKYIDKIGNKHFEQITCVTCHMGNTKPVISVDSLAKK